MNTKKLTSDNFEEIVDDAVKIITSGGTIIAPFDTVYGFIADPRNESALKKIFILKKRPLDKTIGLCTTSIPALETFAEINHKDFIKSHIFGPYTFILKLKNGGQNSNDRSISAHCIKNETVAVLPQNHSNKSSDFFTSLPVDFNWLCSS